MIKKAMVNKGHDAEGLATVVSQHQGEVIADYGQSVLVRMDEAGMDALAARRFRLRELPDDQAVEFNGFRFNPSEARFQSSESTSFASASPSGRSHHLLRLVGPMHPAWRTELETLGVTLYEQVVTDEYLIAIDSAKVGSLHTLPFVEAVSPYYPALKINEALLTPQLQAELASDSGLDIVPLERGSEQAVERSATGLSADSLVSGAESPLSDVGNIELVLFDTADREEAASRVKQIGAQLIRERENVLILSAPTALLPQLAALPSVRTINPYQEPRFFNSVATEIIQAPLLHNHTGLTGRGQIVGVADSGLDTGDVNAISADFAGRIVSLHALGRPGYADDPDGHGTHVAGSVLGNGANSNGNVRGLAPEAQLVFQSVLDASGGFGGLPANLGVGLFDVAKADGARIHNNSWGADVNGSYHSFSAQADTFAFNNRDFLILFAAGNDAPRRVGSPGTAKNVLTVGASESIRALPASVTFPASPVFPNGATATGFNTQADNPNDIAAFSSIGPAQNNRLKPDVVAPGSWILSARSSTAIYDAGPDGLGPKEVPPSGTGDEDGVATHDEAVGSGLPGRPIFGAGSHNTPDLPAGSGANAFERYMYLSGTSMATPITAGSCALLRQYLIEQRGHVPSAALLKALVVNGAVDMGQPANRQGWGRLALEHTLFPLGTGRVQYDDTLENALATGDLRSYDVHVAATAVPLIVTLVWRDPPGAHIQNQLLLRVIHQASGAEFAAETGQSVLNNVQKVTVPSPTPGLYRIEVEALSISQGISEFPNELRQDYALVIANGAGFSCNPSDVVQVIDRSGSMRFYGYMEPAKQRASELVDLLQINDRTGVVSFAESSASGVPMPLTTIAVQPDKTVIKSAINGIVAHGLTDLREALEDGLATLGPDVGRPRALVFLSDGRHTVPTAPIDNAFLDSVAAQARVYTIALGPASDFATLNQIAERTGTGAVYTVESAADLHKLHEIYYDIMGSLGCGGVAHLASAEFGASNSLWQTAHVDQTALEATFVFSWSANLKYVKTTLVAPDGSEYAHGSAEVRQIDGETYQIYRVTRPLGGKWQLHASVDRRDGRAWLTTAVLVDSSVRCAIAHKQKDGELWVHLQGNFGDRPIDNAHARAIVTYPTRSIAELLQLYANELRQIKVNKDLLNGAADPVELAQLNILAAQVGQTGKDIFERKTVEIPLQLTSDSGLDFHLNVRDLGAQGNAQVTVFAEAEGEFGTHTCTKLIPVYVAQESVQKLRGAWIVRRNKLWQHHILGVRVMDEAGRMLSDRDGVGVELTVTLGRDSQVVSLLYYARGGYFINRLPQAGKSGQTVRLSARITHHGRQAATLAHTVKL